MAKIVWGGNGYGGGNDQTLLCENTELLMFHFKLVHFIFQ